MRIIPAIDIYNGKCVRLHQGDFSTRQEYDSDPKEAAMRFAAAGARVLHVVDLEGAKNGAVVNWPALKRILSVQGISVQFGGGLRTPEEIVKCLDAGVDRVVIGSVAVSAPLRFGEWVANFGAQKFCVAVDVRNGTIATDGWQIQGEKPMHAAIAELTGTGVDFFLCTDISRDGALSGPNIPLYRELCAKYNSIHWLASGGIRSKQDLLHLQHTGIHGAIVGKALYENVLRLDDLVEFLC